jgi:hypothetical protein
MLDSAGDPLKRLHPLLSRDPALVNQSADQPFEEAPAQQVALMGPRIEAERHHFNIGPIAKTPLQQADHRGLATSPPASERNSLATFLRIGYQCGEGSGDFAVTAELVYVSGLIL